MPGQSTEESGNGFVRCSHCGISFSHQLFKCPNCATPLVDGTRIPRTRVLRNSDIKSVDSGVFVARMAVSRFTLTAYLGSGGIGEVWEAETEFGYKIALKIIPVTDDQDTGKLIRDYDATRNINDYSHVIRYETPELVNVSGTGKYLIIPMELMEGDAGQLKKWFGEMPMAVRERLIIGDLLPQVLEGLDVCHQSGIVHLDLKPANILHTKGRHLDLKPANILHTKGRSKYKIADFGISLIMDSVSQITGTHTRTTDGTLQYMPPERIAGERGDCRSDFFSLGITLCELLFGTPYPEDSPEVSSRLHSFLDRFIEQNPNLRYQSVAEIRRSVSTERHLKIGQSYYVEENHRESVHTDQEHQGKTKEQESVHPGREQNTEQKKHNKKLLFGLIGFGILVFLVLPITFFLNGSESLMMLINDLAETNSLSQEHTSDQQETNDLDQSISNSATENNLSTESSPFESALSDTDKHELISVVNNYLQASTWEERLQYVWNREDVRDEMEEYYRGIDLSEYDYSDRKRILAEDFGGPATGDESVQVVMLPLKTEHRFIMHPLPLYYVMRYTRDGWKIDWHNRPFPSSPTRLDLLKVDRPTSGDPPAVIYAFVAFDDFYNFQFSGKENEYYSLSMEIPYKEAFTSMYGFVPRDSTTGQEIYKILSESDWEAVPVTLKVSYLTQDETDPGHFDSDLLDILLLEHPYFY